VCTSLRCPPRVWVSSHVLGLDAYGYAVPHVVGLPSPFRTRAMQSRAPLALSDPSIGLNELALLIQHRRIQYTIALSLPETEVKRTRTFACEVREHYKTHTAYNKHETFLLRIT